MGHGECSLAARDVRALSTLVLWAGQASDCPWKEGQHTAPGAQLQQLPTSPQPEQLLLELRMLKA